MMDQLKASELCKILRCDPDGKLFWLPRPPEMFRKERHCKGWNKRWADKEAFTFLDSNGYKRGSIFGRLYLAHRVIWAMETGEWPVDQIDHENHIRNDNRFENLSEATNTENHKNETLRVTNKSGFVGVSWHRKSQKWMAQIRADGNVIYLGVFIKKDDAIKIRKEANVQYGYNKNHGRTKCLP